MWFYGLVGNDQSRDPWIDEGLATWGEHRVEGGADALADGEPLRPGRAGEPMTYWDDRAGEYYEHVYLQPAIALAQLGAPDVVDCALAHFVARHAHRIATGDDLLAALELVHDDPAAVLAPFGLP
jgi:hypothetical protein